MAHINQFEYSEADDTIYGFYNSSIDITNIHRKVVRILQHKQNNGILSLFDEAKAAIIAINDSDRTPDASLKTGVNIFERAVKKLANIDTDSLASYTERSKPYIDRIKQTSGELKLALVASYLKLIKEYIKINISKQDNDNDDNVCSCGEVINEDDIDVCSKCGLVSKCYLATSAFTDSKYGSESSSKPKTRYDKFKDRHLRYQCRAGKVIDPTILNKLTNYLKNKYPSLTHNPKDRLKNLDLLKKVLKACSLTSLMPDINLIAHTLWKYEIPNIRHLDDIIEDQWNKMQEVLDIEKSSDDKATMEFNGWRQWRQYIQAGYDCDPLEFDMPNTKVLERSEELWARGCKKLKWKVDVILEY